MLAPEKLKENERKNSALKKISTVFSTDERTRRG
jgi:hypothetical protein